MSKFPAATRTASGPMTLWHDSGCIADAARTCWSASVREQVIECLRRHMDEKRGRGEGHLRRSGEARRTNTKSSLLYLLSSMVKRPCRPPTSSLLVYMSLRSIKACMLNRHQRCRLGPLWATTLGTTLLGSQRTQAGLAHRGGLQMQLTKESHSPGFSRGSAAAIPASAAPHMLPQPASEDL